MASHQRSKWPLSKACSDRPFEDPCTRSRHAHVTSGQGHYTTRSNSALYAEQTEALYSESDMTPPPATRLDREYVTTTLRSMVTTITEWSQLHDDIGFFNQGMDPLLRLSAAIRSRLGASVSPSVIYSHPSITLLVPKICQDATTDAKRDQPVPLLQNDSSLRDVQGHHLSVSIQPKALSSSPAQPATVGSFVQAQLLDDPGVARVYCLNRSTESESLQKTRNLKRGIHIPVSPNSVTFVTVDLTQPFYGLDAPHSRHF